MSIRDLMGLLKVGQYAASLKEKELYAIAKLAAQSSADLLEEWFETDALKGTKAASGIIGTFLGPRSPGTAYVLLHHYMGEIDGAFRAWGFAKNGSGGVSGSIFNAAKALGVEIRVNCYVKQVKVKNGRAVGVVLENGDEIDSKVVMSAADPKRTFLQFVEQKHFPDEFVTAIQNFRTRGSSGKLSKGRSDTCLVARGLFGVRASDFFRISGFGFRIWRSTKPLTHACLRMLFHTWPFLIFLAVVLPVFFALRKTRLWLPWLTLASYFFYGWWNPYYLFLVAYATVLDFSLVALMDHCPREGRAVDVRARLTRLRFDDQVLRFAFLASALAALGVLVLALIGPRTLRPTLTGLGVLVLLMALGALFSSAVADGSTLIS